MRSILLFTAGLFSLAVASPCRHSSIAPSSSSPASTASSAAEITSATPSVTISSSEATSTSPSAISSTSVSDTTASDTPSFTTSDIAPSPTSSVVISSTAALDTTTSDIPSTTTIPSVSTTAATSAAAATTSAVSLQESCAQGDTPATYTAANGDSYTIECNAFYARTTGSTINIISSDSFESCIATCSTTANCVVVDWVEDSLQCYLLSSTIYGHVTDISGFDNAVLQSN